MGRTVGFAVELVVEGDADVEALGPELDDELVAALPLLGAALVSDVAALGREAVGSGAEEQAVTVRVIASVTASAIARDRASDRTSPIVSDERGELARTAYARSGEPARTAYARSGEPGCTAYRRMADRRGVRVADMSVRLSTEGNVSVCPRRSPGRGRSTEGESP
ncbi:MAG: hypothetical protein IPL93_03555 [Actinomycetales bacterium]|nr:hypothetical protein [Actinomycetales bacterium]